MSSRATRRLPLMSMRTIGGPSACSASVCGMLIVGPAAWRCRAGRRGRLRRRRRRARRRPPCGVGVAVAGRRRRSCVAAPRGVGRAARPASRACDAAAAASRRSGRRRPRGAASRDGQTTAPEDRDRRASGRAQRAQTIGPSRGKRACGEEKLRALSTRLSLVGQPSVDARGKDFRRDPRVLALADPAGRRRSAARPARGRSSVQCSRASAERPDSAPRTCAATRGTR